MIRFRLYDYAAISDLEKAFLMINLDKCDRDATRFFWPENVYDPNSKILVFRFKVVLFGSTASQFLLNACIKYHLENVGTPNALNLSQSLYVDNVLTSVPTETDLINFYVETKKIMRNADFNLREWASNSAKLRSLATSTGDIMVDKDCNVVIQPLVLGLCWNTDLNNLCCDIPYYDETVKITKRSILSDSAKTFYPLGFLLPVTIRSRIILQDIWKCTID